MPEECIENEEMFSLLIPVSIAIPFSVFHNNIYQIQYTLHYSTQIEL